MPYVIQSTYRQDYTPPNVDRYNISQQYEAAIKEDCELQKKKIPLEDISNEEKKCEPEWTKLERMELIMHQKLVMDKKVVKGPKKKSVIAKNNKFTEKIDRDLCVSPVCYKKCPGEFRTTYQQDYPDLNPNKSSPYDNLTPQYPRQYTDLGDTIVPDDKTIAEYTKKCAKLRKAFVSKGRNEISDALPSGKCKCLKTEYQHGIGRMGGIFKKKRLDGTENKVKKCKNTCGW